MTTKELEKLDKLEKEVKSLRQDVDLFIPKESLEEYKNPEKIKKSYQEALKDHPLHES